MCLLGVDPGTYSGHRAQTLLPVATLEDYQQIVAVAEDAALNHRWSAATLKKVPKLWRTSTNDFKDRFDPEALDRKARLDAETNLNNVLNELLSTEKSFVAMLEELNQR